MVARTSGDQEGGQSVLEFLVLLPAMVGLTVLLVRVNTVIQVSLVNQKYARAQILFLTMNSSEYPTLENRFASDGMYDLESNEMIVGVSNKVAPDAGEDYPPDPIIYKITRPGGPGGDDSEPEPDRRDKIRVRNTVSLCTQLNFVKVNGTKVPYDGRPVTGNAQFEFCKGVFQ